MTKLAKTLFIFLLMTTPVAFAEDIVVVVNVNNPTNTMTRSEVIDLFMGRYVAFPNGDSATPIEFEGATPIKKSFYKNLVGMPLARINAYWSRLRFSGKQRSTIHLNNEESVIEKLENDRSAIAYIEKSKISNNMKIIYVVVQEK